MNVVMTGDGRFIEVQGTAEGAPFDRSALDALLDLAATGCAELTRLQHAALGAPVRREPGGRRSVMIIRPAREVGSSLGSCTALLLVACSARRRRDRVRRHDPCAHRRLAADRRVRCEDPATAGEAAADVRRGPSLGARRARARRVRPPPRTWRRSTRTWPTTSRPAGSQTCPTLTAPVLATGGRVHVVRRPISAGSCSRRATGTRSIEVGRILAERAPGLVRRRPGRRRAGPARHRRDRDDVRRERVDQGARRSLRRPGSRRCPTTPGSASTH